MSDSHKKRAHVLSSFKDEGTGESFTSGDAPLMDAGQFENYKAAGLVEAAPATKSAPRSAAKPKSKSKAKAVRAAKPTAPAQPVQPALTPATGEGVVGE